jgi:hypothetical protein
MKKHIKVLLWLSPLLLSCVAHSATNIKGFNPQLLAPNPPNGTEVAFRGGSTKVRLTNGDFFKMQGFGDRVEFQSVSTKDWFFDNKVIYPWELPLTSLSSIKDSDILTITATSHHNASEQFNINVIKYMEQGRIMLRVIAISAVPEPAHAVLLLGFAALIFIMIKHRKQ